MLRNVSMVYAAPLLAPNCPCAKGIHCLLGANTAPLQAIHIGHVYGVHCLIKEKNYPLWAPNRPCLWRALSNYGQNCPVYWLQTGHINGMHCKLRAKLPYIGSKLPMYMSCIVYICLHTAPLLALNWPCTQRASSIQSTNCPMCNERVNFPLIMSNLTNKIKLFKCTKYGKIW